MGRVRMHRATIKVTGSGMVSSDIVDKLLEMHYESDVTFAIDQNDETIIQVYSIREENK